MDSEAELRARFDQSCPVCGHHLYAHPRDHYWPDGRTCNACTSNPAGLVGTPSKPNPCCLTSGEVELALVAGSPECPNQADPVLCKWNRELKRIIPESGCPLHDYALHPKETSA